MDVAISSKPEEKYLLIKASGRIVSVEEYKLLQNLYYDEIVKYDYESIIVDEVEMQLPMSLMAQNEIVKFFYDELPEEIKNWRIAAILPANYMDIAKYWEHEANKSGYTDFKVFPSIDDAIYYINRQGTLPGGG